MANPRGKGADVNKTNCHWLVAFCSRLLTAVLLLLIAVLGLFALSAQFSKPPLQALTVLSGSMRATLPQSSLVVIKKTDGQNLKKNDVISYQKAKQVVTHRIVEVTKAGFYTKGDSNHQRDAQIVSPEEVLGKVVFSIPKLGSVLLLLQSKEGKLATLLTILDLLLLDYFIKLLFKGASIDEEQKT